MSHITSTECVVKVALNTNLHTLKYLMRKKTHLRWIKGIYAFAGVKKREKNGERK